MNKTGAQSEMLNIEKEQRTKSRRKCLMINILVVEDDVKLNQIVCTYLNDSGFQA